MEIMFYKSFEEADAHMTGLSVSLCGYIVHDGDEYVYGLRLGHSCTPIGRAKTKKAAEVAIKDYVQNKQQDGD